MENKIVKCHSLMNDILRDVKDMDFTMAQLITQHTDDINVDTLRECRGYLLSVELIMNQIKETIKEKGCVR